MLVCISEHFPTRTASRLIQRANMPRYRSFFIRNLSMT
jgi:hypothetical protein